MAGSITAWLDRMRDGDQTAAERLWSYFSPDLLRRLAPECRGLRICDEEDIATTAFYQLTKAMEENKAEGITNRKEFWRLLRVITKRKVKDWIRYDKAIVRGGEHNVVSMCDSNRDQFEDVHKTSYVLDHELNLLDRFQQMVDKMDRPEFGQIIRLKVQGLHNSEIARELRLSLRTVQYLILDIKNAWVQTFKGEC